MFLRFSFLLIVIFRLMSKAIAQEVVNPQSTFF
jgi:hypothetical protein